MFKLNFEAPKSAPAHIVLRRAVLDKGMDEDALRRLFWLVNAHPKLTAHAQVFKNIGDHLVSETFQAGALAWAEGWVDDIPAWIIISRWLWSHRVALKRIQVLSTFDQQPSHKFDHPHLQKGAVRHGVPAALWNVHESSVEDPRLAEAGVVAAARYSELQRHVLAAYIDCRFRLSTLEFYEGYTGRLEQPVAPTRSKEVSPAIRVLSLNKYIPLLIQLHSKPSTKAFAESIQDQRFIFKDIPEDARHSAEQYLDAIQRYFHRYLRVLEGWKPDQSTGRGRGKGGGNARRPGFVNLPAVPGVYLEDSLSAPDDSDIAHQSGQRILVDCDPDNDDKPEAVEASGIAPAETLEEAFHLYSPAELKGQLMAVRHQRLAIQMRAQALSIDYCNLTPQELRDVWFLADKRISRYLRTESPYDAVRNAAIASLILKLSLCYGQKIETVRGLGLTWLLENNLGSLPSIEDSQPKLIIESAVMGDWDHARLVGLHVPAIMPNYKVTLPEELNDFDREYAPSFVLPDHIGLGHQLINFLRIQPPFDASLFGIQAKTLQQAFEDLLQELRNERITPDKVALVLPNLVTSLTGDQSLTWLLTANTSFADEPRMHYTRQSVRTLLAAYRRASTRLSRTIGIPISHESGPAIGKVDHAASVGARFVLARSELTEIVTSLVDDLSDRYVDRENDDEMVRYHNLYVLFTAIYQSLCTSMRTITSPSALYLTWSRQADKLFPVGATLSDKDTNHNDKARLALISATLAKQFAHFRAHDEYLRSDGYVGSRPSLWFQLQTSKGRRYRPFFTLTKEMVLEPLTPGWVVKELHDYTEYPIPANFHRAFLRTELLERGCPVEVIDAFLGHFNQGESPYATFSSFDYQRYCTKIECFLRDIHNDLGLRPIASRLIPYGSRPVQSQKRTVAR